MERDIKAENCEENEAVTKGRELSPAALRALAEAQERRNAQEKLSQEESKHVREIGGRGGQDPARFGDWEVKGRAIDF